MVPFSLRVSSWYHICKQKQGTSNHQQKKKEKKKDIFHAKREFTMHLLNTNKAPQNILKTNKQLLMNKSIKNSKCIFTNQAIKLLLNYPWLYLSLMTELGMLIFICLSMRLNLIHGQFKVKDPQVYL